MRKKLLIVFWCIVTLTLAADNSTFICSDGTVLSSEDRCSGLAQCNDCSDEINCEGQSDHFSCESPFGAKCLSEVFRCDSIAHCQKCTDEINCRNSTVLLCENAEENESGCFGIAQFCNGANDCKDGSDEKTTGFGFKCASAVRSSSKSLDCLVSQESLKGALNQPSGICEGKVDKCFKIVGDKLVFDETICWTCLDGTIIQKAQVCDEFFDCPDLSDECLCLKGNSNTEICDSLLNNEHCGFGQVSCPEDNKCFPASSICSDASGCSSIVIDKYCSKNAKQCAENKGTQQQYSCGSALIDGFDEAISCNGVFECLSGDDECQAGCENESLYCGDISIFDHSVRFDNCSNVGINQLCDKTNDCADGIDERYCPYLQLCDSRNISSGYFDNRTCGEDRCNLEAACDNIADEFGCNSSTHIYCDNNTKFFSRRQLLNGNPDCNDFSDECDLDPKSVSSEEDLIGNIFLRALLWIFMFLSLIGNGIVICKTIHELLHVWQGSMHRSTLNIIGICNKIMILNLSLADFLMGIYLLIITISSVELSGEYCRRKLEWLKSQTCSFAGILAVVSSEASVFLMVLMTSYRLYGVTNPFRAHKLRCKIIYFATGVIWLLSLLLATIPVFPSLKSTFASFIQVSQPYSNVSLDLSTLSHIIENANRLPGLTASIPIPSSVNIEAFCSLFNNTLPSYCENPNEFTAIQGYYGSDGVCLPRLFGDKDEPASTYSILLVTLNFLAFLYMFGAYLYIYRSTSLRELKDDEPSCSAVDDNRSKENKQLWGKIVRLIVTDFICWVPICVMAFISLGGVDLPDVIYSITAVVLIPINSAANPWLYSSFMAVYARKLYHHLTRIFKKKRKITSTGSERTVQICMRHRQFCSSFKRRRSHADHSIDVLPSSPSSNENTANENLTVDTEL